MSANLLGAMGYRAGGGMVWLIFAKATPATVDCRFEGSPTLTGGPGGHIEEAVRTAFTTRSISKHSVIGGQCGRCYSTIIISIAFPHGLSPDVIQSPQALSLSGKMQTCT